MQLHGLLELPLLIQIVDPHERLGKHVGEARDRARRPRGEPADQEVRLAAERGEAVGGEFCGQTRDLRHGAAGEFHADDVAVRLGQARDGRRVKVNAVADGREVVDHDGQGAFLCDVVEEAVDHRRRRLLAEVRRWEEQDVVRACIGGVRDEFQHLLRRVPADAGHEGIRWPACITCGFHQCLPLLARQEKRLGVRAQDDQSGEAAFRQVAVVFRLGVGV